MHDRAADSDARWSKWWGSPACAESGSALPVAQRPAADAGDSESTAEESGSGGGMGWGMLVAMIAIPTAVALIAVLLIWSFEKSRREAHHREAQSCRRQGLQ